jgi:hypothetical protein
MDVYSMSVGSGVAVPMVNLAQVDDEHRLIARYAARLAADSYNAVS